MDLSCVDFKPARAFSLQARLQTALLFSCHKSDGQAPKRSKLRENRAKRRPAAAFSLTFAVLEQRIHA
ncbi:MAG: hypothetical protein EBU47_03090 [Betaproteobacteria bacterium]|nr:hypothetical protein [Betaproteobacteria bacterium]NDG17997.1 hypothetical protein [Betaproteobacteria bacterium]